MYGLSLSMESKGCAVALLDFESVKYWSTVGDALKVLFGEECFILKSFFLRPPCHCVSPSTGTESPHRQSCERSI